MVMEDDAHLRNVFTRALQSAGYEVHQAAAVDEARALLSGFDFDVLICDIHVGKSRGTDLLREHGEMLLNSGGQIVMVSGYPRYRAVCEEMGADFFLEKPVSIKTLVTLMDRLTRAPRVT
jgi:two-component system phosphate regulon response regulator OmpR